MTEVEEKAKLFDIRQRGLALKKHIVAVQGKLGELLTDLQESRKELTKIKKQCVEMGDPL